MPHLQGGVRDEKLTTEQEFNRRAIVDKINALLDEVDRVGDSWHSGKDSTESLRRLRVLASSYIHSLQQAVASMGECVNQTLDENERLVHANQQIAAASVAMEELTRGLGRSNTDLLVPLDSQMDNEMSPYIRPPTEGSKE